MSIFKGKRVESGNKAKINNRNMGKCCFSIKFIHSNEFRMSFSCPAKELTLVILKAVTKRIRDDGMGGGDHGKTPWHLDGDVRARLPSPRLHSTLSGRCVLAWPPIGSSCCPFPSHGSECRTAGEAWRRDKGEQSRARRWWMYGRRRRRHCAMVRNEITWLTGYCRR